MTTMPENLLKDCIGCGLTKSFIFDVLYRGHYRRFCTACILKNHSGCFCPICFEVFDFSKPLPSHQRLTCFNCSSVSHVGCVKPPPSATRYRCPACSDSNFSFFDLSHRSFKKFRITDGVPQHSKAIDKSLAKQLLAAATIAASSMTKGAASARIEAEKRVNEAAETRKMAKESMEQVAQLVATEEYEYSQMFNHVNFASPFLSSNWVQNQSPANGSVPPSINAVSLPETLRNESNGLHSSVSRH